jgi:hypothetical protein
MLMYVNTRIMSFSKAWEWSVAGEREIKKREGVWDGTKN